MRARDVAAVLPEKKSMYSKHRDWSEERKEQPQVIVQSREKLLSLRQGKKLCFVVVRSEKRR